MSYFSWGYSVHSDHYGGCSHIAVNVPVLIGSDGSIALYMTPAIGILMPGGIAENAIKSLYE